MSLDIIIGNGAYAPTSNLCNKRSIDMNLIGHSPWYLVICLMTLEHIENISIVHISSHKVLRCDIGQKKERRDTRHGELRLI